MKGKEDVLEVFEVINIGEPPENHLFSWDVFIGESGLNDVSGTGLLDASCSESKVKYDEETILEEVC